MYVRLILSAALAALCVPACACDGDKPERPFKKEAARFQVMLAERQYDELERWASKSENLSERLADGQSLHAAFLSGVKVLAPCGKSMDPVYMMAAEGHRAHVQEWLKRYPASRSAQLANAFSPMSLAWAARGTGYASKVEEAAWPIFSENVGKARAALESLPDAVRNDPGWYSAMLEILKLQSASDNEYDALLSEAVARYPDYETIWMEAGSHYAPKWGGSPQKLRALAQRAADATRNRLGDTMYARVEWANWDYAMFRNGQADWGRMKAGFERLMADYPHNWNANHFAKFACIAQDADALHKAFARIDKPLREAWGNEGLYETCKRHAENSVQPVAVSR